MLSEWSNAPHAELAVVLSALRAQAMLLQTAHWSTRGETFYGDHLLFERLYGVVNGEVDMVAEKAVGVGSANFVNAPLQLKQMYKIMCMYDESVSTIPQPSDWARKCYTAEQHIIGLVDQAIESLKSSGCLTKGVDNMLVGILDAHENNCYLLKQRII
jgi:DNA-binding ferritin-like protein